jgi:hypothetical protein
VLAKNKENKLKESLVPVLVGLILALPLVAYATVKSIIDIRNRPEDVSKMANLWDCWRGFIFAFLYLVGVVFFFIDLLKK